ncbi:XRE family transcriptional regulator [Candidatus Xianfuyuplasma coldseepsis]|uniref:XRE family transcriptional regulator n=1 Tax=Candidatus Xianfuyuplasma coldseepsis TaxID=2782163 RepID=A0A7L7KRE7_9MOLU|nr:XRE family transcriptional regulator [Xianfuyuplasma coldseepsis]QMS84378.1 XRE family transcriptional regulator [Xianfuyuplasma coldseepsis]
MEFKIKEARAEYHVTQKELSEITEIPLRTIENWESGKRKPSPWVEKLIDSHLKQFPKNERGIITMRKNTYNIDQIKEAVLPVTLKYDINRIILFGSYSKGIEDELSDIDIAVDTNARGLTFLGIVDEICTALVKDVDVINFRDIVKDSDFMKDVLKGVVLYER